MYDREIFEGGGNTIPMGRTEYEYSLNDALTKILIWRIVKVMMKYSGFCVLKGLLEMNNRRGYVNALIRSRAKQA